MADELKEEPKKKKRIVRVLKKQLKEYDRSFPFTPAESIDDAHTTAELVHFAENDKSVDIEARVLCLTEDGIRHKRLNKTQFIEAYKANEKDSYRLRESFDSFNSDASLGAGLVGDDFIPLLGGPFNKQLYMQDYLRQHAAAFHAASHDPFAKRVVQLIRQFVLGKGFRINVKGGKDEDVGSGIILACEKQNKLQELAGYVCTELSTYGEVMVWRLPNNQTKIEWQLRPEQMSPRGLLPRYRLIDPSTCWEIVGYPEDINRPLYFQLVYPTQYQIYTNGDVPTSKFIVQQVPADQVWHYKVNTVSNEKRGRSDLFPLLGYFKRMRDLANWRVIREQKNAAWSIDTTIEGNDDDLQAYVDSMEALGEVAPAGSDFAHTSKVKREYLGNQVGSSGDMTSFEILMNMIAAGSGIPVSYFGVTGVQGQSRASALVGTEPVAKFIEERQQIMERILRSIIDDTLAQMGNLDVEYEIIFPEIITQDRSAKIKDIIVAQSEGYIAKSNAAAMVAKELNITDYEYESEQETIRTDNADDANVDTPPVNPLSMGMGGSGSGGAGPSKSGGSPKPSGQLSKPSAVTSQDKRAVSMNKG